MVGHIDDVRRGKQSSDMDQYAEPADTGVEYSYHWWATEG